LYARAYNPNDSCIDIDRSGGGDMDVDIGLREENFVAASLLNMAC